MADFQEILYSRASIRAFTDAELSDGSSPSWFAPGLRRRGHFTIMRGICA